MPVSVEYTFFGHLIPCNTSFMLEELIKKGESDTLEFKSSMRASTKPDLAIVSLQDEHYQQGTSSRGRILQPNVIAIIKIIEKIPNSFTRLGNKFKRIFFMQPLPP